MELESIINNRPRRRSELADWYRALLEAGEAVGLSTRDLASRLGCCAETVYGWRRKLRGTGSPATSTERRGLIEVRAVEEPTHGGSRSEDRLEVRLLSGQVLLVPEGIDARTLTTVLEALGRC